MGIPLYQVDAFTSEPFRGNPAGICLLESDASDDWMQAVAAEMNLSETAFLVKRDDAWHIRYFTPEVEIPLCGHTTVASAHVLWSEGIVADSQPVHFSAKGGEFIGTREDGRITIDFPAHTCDEAQPPVGLSDAIGATPASAHRIREGGWLIEFESEQTVATLSPDLLRLRSIKPGGLIATAQSSTRARDFVSRFFAPDIGIDEDPVTGVAHLALGPYWAKRLGKTEMTAVQLSRRTGTLRVRVADDRVYIMADAATVFRAELLATP
jgi:PhzF family phenazine biosynthesis protein